MFADIHAHILPNIDDGPKTVEESLELLSLAVAQGCDRVIATPHFYAVRHGLTERLDLTARRLKEFQSAIKASDIKVDILSGYEVRYFEGISHSENIGSLCLNGSKFLLLELGPEPITENIIEEIMELNYYGFIVILAHIERYFKLSGFKGIKQLVSSGSALAQVNATSFLTGPFARVSSQLLKADLISFIAGDMHSILHRPPNMAEAFDYISNKFGKQYRDRLIANSDELFSMIG